MDASTHRASMFRTSLACFLCTACCLGLSLPASLRAAESPFLTFAAGKADVTIGHAGDDYLRFGLAAWGPNWKYTSPSGQTKSEGDTSVASLNGRMGGTEVPFTVGFRAARPAPRQLQLTYELQSQADTALTMFAIEMQFGTPFDGTNVVVTAQGKPTKVTLPLDKRGLGKGVESITLTDKQGRTTVVRFDRPIDVASDGAARIMLAEKQLAGAKPSRVTITVDLPAETSWYPSVTELPDVAGLEQWYRWQATGADGQSLIGMGDWLEAPAGKHGRITRQGDSLVYNGQPIKLWGLNLCYGACAPEKELADKRAAFYRKYGVNTVRLHKYADGAGWAGIQSADSFVEFDTEGLDRMDYQVAKFKESGIYVKLSAHFGSQKLGPGDAKYVPFLDEFGKTKGKGDRVTTPHSAVHYSPELQKVQILQMVNLFKHKNAHTGLTYAEDPAVAYIEIINEQSILFYSSMSPLQASPTLRKQVAARFCQWLREKYGSQAKLEAAWSKQAFDSFASEGITVGSGGEQLDEDNIVPLGNPWYWDPQQLAGTQAYRKQRLLDTLEFLYLLECEFYDRYVKAVREAGYQGEIVSSNWQAGRAFSHFANLHADARVGTVDRHNYFGSNRANASMLARAGSGMLSSGMQQVGDRPFMLSEWIHVSPNEMGGEGVAIIGAYGMGLQGWDVSYMFQNRDNGEFSEKIGRDRWDVTAPQVLGLFPAVARQVLRGDVKQADLVAPRNVHVPSLFEAKLSFDDQVAQGYDDKELTSSKVPAQALAVARCVVNFTKTYEDTPLFDLKPYVKNGWIVSSTGQLRWKEASAASGGCFAIDTPGTKAVVGFAGGQAIALGNVTIASKTGYAAVYVTARGPGQTIDTASELLVVAIARSRNTGMKFSPSGDRLLAPGQPPIIMEPVRAQVTIRRTGTPKVIVLDHDGKATDRTVSAGGGEIAIDGARDKTPYYLIRYQ